jgi:hypothetical protein
LLRLFTVDIAMAEVACKDAGCYCNTSRKLPTAKSSAKCSAKKKELADKVPYISLDRPIGGFGSRPLPTPESMYIRGPRLSGGGNGSVTTKKELGIKLTDYFDYSSFDAAAGGVPQFVSNYFWDVNQNLFNTSSDPPGGQENTFCRVRSLCVWVMPQSRDFGGTLAAQPQTNARAMFTVNAQVPGVTTQPSASSFEAYALNTQVTNVLPTINPTWKKVLSCDLQKTFQSGVARPVFAGPFPSQQCLFQMSIVNPTDGTPYFVGDDEFPVRVKVQLMLDQPIGTTQAASFVVYRNEEFALPFTPQNGISYPGASEQYVQMDLQSVRDNLR